MTATRIKIHGESDDTIQVTQEEPQPTTEIDLTDEFYATGRSDGDEGCVVVLRSVGGHVDVFDVTYTPTGWRIAHAVISGALVVDLQKAPPELVEDESQTDVCTIRGQIEDVDTFDSWPPDDEDVRNKLEDVIDFLEGDDLLEAYASARAKSRADE